MSRPETIAERDRRWFALFRSGKSAVEIAREEGFCPEHVRNRIRAVNGGPVLAPRSDADKIRVACLREKGASFVQIAHMMGVSKGVVAGLVERAKPRDAAT